MSETIPKNLHAWKMNYYLKKLVEAKKEWADAVDKVDAEYNDVEIPLINVLPLLDAVYDAGHVESNLKSLLNLLEEEMAKIKT